MPRASLSNVEKEAAAFEPSHPVPGIGVRPDKMLLGHVFAYAHAQRADMAVNDNKPTSVSRPLQRSPPSDVGGGPASAWRALRA